MDISRIGEEQVSDIELIKGSQKDDKSKSKKTGEEALKSSTADKVELSSRASELNEVQRILEETPEIRQNKVEQMKKAIAEGYNPSGLEIADAMIGDMSEEEFLARFFSE